jgi:UDP-N-acetyl-D-mannosaminuronic acid dehydrogenase
MKIAVIGLGRVGLPLALVLESLGMKVIGIDRDVPLVGTLRKRVMPFREEGCDELLATSAIQFTDSIREVREADYIVITVGTPLYNHIEADLGSVRAVCSELVHVVRPGQTIILRSTVAPETTLYIRQFLEMHTRLVVGSDIGLAFCPERLAENHALRELRLLPQVIGAEDDLSRDRAKALFKRFAVRLFFTNYLSAELVKLFNNISRYLDFAVANQFAVIANQYHQNIYDIIHMANEDYPRGFIYSPGFTAGTCLRKDFGLLNERTATPDLLLSAWKINEHMPFHLVEALTRRVSLYDKDVAVLGYTFKKNSDDTRDSLVPKLVRYIERHVPRKITICEPHLDRPEIDGYRNVGLDECLADAEVVFVAMNHDHFVYHNALLKIRNAAWVVDIWNALGQNQFIFRKDKGEFVTWEALEAADRRPTAGPGDGVRVLKAVAE